MCCKFASHLGFRAIIHPSIHPFTRSVVALRPDPSRRRPPPPRNARPHTSSPHRPSSSTHANPSTERIRERTEMSETRARADDRASASASASSSSFFLPARVVSSRLVIDLDAPRCEIPRRVRARFDERSRRKTSPRSSLDRSRESARRPRRGRDVEEVRRFVRPRSVGYVVAGALFRRDRERTDRLTLFHRRREGTWTSTCAKNASGKTSSR